MAEGPMAGDCFKEWEPRWPEDVLGQPECCPTHTGPEDTPELTALGNASRFYSPVRARIERLYFTHCWGYKRRRPSYKGSADRGVPGACNDVCM